MAKISNQGGPALNVGMKLIFRRIARSVTQRSSPMTFWRSLWLEDQCLYIVFQTRDQEHAFRTGLTVEEPEEIEETGQSANREQNGVETRDQVGNQDTPSNHKSEGTKVPHRITQTVIIRDPWTIDHLFQHQTLSK